MMKRYTFWLWTAVVVIFVNFTLHSIGLFINPTPQDPTHAQMLHLMETYPLKLGPLFHPTMASLFTALSSCLSLLSLLAGLTIVYLLKKRVEVGVMKGLIAINLLVFGIGLVIFAALTFLLPVILTGLIVVCLLGAFLTARSVPAAT